MTGRGDSGLEGQRAISAAEMSEEFDSASRRTVSDEFLREEIGCCPEEVNISLEKMDPSVSVEMTT
jgi:hypothetical protein